MANYQSLKTAINAVIKANGNKEITGTVLNEVLLAMVNSLGAGYQFAGVATPDTTPGTPDQKVFYIASQAGTYNNFGGAVVSDGIAIFEWNGIWTTETLDLPVLEQVQSDWTEDDTTKKSYIKHKPNIPEEQVQSDWTETDTAKKSYIKHKPNIPPSANVDPVPTEDSPNAVSSGGTYNMIVSTAATLFGNIQDATNVNATLSEDGKIYNDYNAGDIFYIEQDDVRKYRVAYAAGTADAEHPVTINGTLFYYADNASDAIWLSLRIKTVSTEQQSLSAQQKAQARTNIAAVSYDQQSLNAEQQVQAQNNMMGKAYAPAQNSGLGKVYLAKNNGVLTQAMMQATNTVYVIQYDFTLDSNITVPANCVLQFDGGSISGEHTITGNNTGINSGLVKIFNTDVSIDGSWDVVEAYPEWFGAKGDGITDDTSPLQSVLLFPFVKLTKKYKVSSVISVVNTKKLFGWGTVYTESSATSVNTVFVLFNNIDISGITFLTDADKTAVDDGTLSTPSRFVIDASLNKYSNVRFLYITNSGNCEKLNIENCKFYNSFEDLSQGRGNDSVDIYLNNCYSENSIISVLIQSGGSNFSIVNSTLISSEYGNSLSHALYLNGNNAKNVIEGCEIVSKGAQTPIEGKSDNFNNSHILIKNSNISGNGNYIICCGNGSIAEIYGSTIKGDCQSITPAIAYVSYKNNLTINSSNIEITQLFESSLTGETDTDIKFLACNIKTTKGFINARYIKTNFVFISCNIYSGDGTNFPSKIKGGVIIQNTTLTINSSGNPPIEIYGFLRIFTSKITAIISNRPLFYISNDTTYVDCINCVIENVSNISYPADSALINKTNTAII